MIGGKRKMTDQPKKGPMIKTDAPIIADLSLGLANQRTKPRRIPDAYRDQTVKDVINYIMRIAEKDSDPDECYLVTSVHDQMKEDYVIKINGYNVNAGDKFSTIIADIPTEDVGDGDNKMYAKVINIIITKIEEAGDCNTCG